MSTAILGSGTVTFGDGSIQSTNTVNQLSSSGYIYPTKLMNTDDNNTIYRRAYVIMSDGRVKAWGQNGDYSLGDGSAANRQFPVDVGFPYNFPGAAEVHSAHKKSQACVDINGQLWTWGRNDQGSLGVGYVGYQGDYPNSTASPQNVSLISSNSIYGKTIKQVAMPCGVQDTGFIMVLCTDGTVHTCGYNGVGQCGIGNTTDQSYFVQVLLSGGSPLTGITQISCGRELYLSCAAVATNGTLYVWGYNGDYNLGKGDTSSNTYYAQPRTNGSLSGKTVVRVSSSTFCMYALCSDATLHGWGSQPYGQLGLGNRSAVTTPAQINTNVISMQTAAYDYPIVTIIKTDGTAYFAGYEGYMIPYNFFTSYDDYGNPQYDQVVTNLWYPLLGPSGDNIGSGSYGTIKKVAHGGTGSYNYVFVLMTNGRVYAYGYNGYGQLGIGSTINDIPNGTTLNVSPYKTGPQLVKIDPVDDLGTYGDGQGAQSIFLTKKNFID